MPLWKSPLWQIAMFAGVLAVLQPVYLLAEHLRGRGPLVLAEVLFSRTVPLAIVLWMVADAKERRRTPCFDFGFFLLYVWPISLFWYCLGTRGWRGLGLSLGLLLLTMVPLLATAVVTVVVELVRVILYG